MKWAKLKDVVIKTGEFKDTGDPARDLTPAEQAYMQSLIDNMFGQFIHAVADGRGMKYDDVKAIANGKVWTGQEALSMKLIDNVGDFEAVVKDTAKSVGISGEPTLVHPERERRSMLDLLLGDVSKYIPTEGKAMEQQVGFYYLWK
jgi:protease IV